MRKLDGVTLEILDMLRLTGEISPSIFKYTNRNRTIYLRQAKIMSTRSDWGYKKGDQLLTWKGIKLISFNGGGKTETKRHIRLTNEAIESGIFDVLERPLDFNKLSITGNAGTVRRNCITAWLGYIFSSLGYRIHVNEKKKLENQPDEKIKDPKDYYTLKETKTTSQDVLTARGRSYGTLIDEDRSFVIYILPSIKTKFYHETEVRSQISITYTLKENLWLSVYYNRESSYFKNALIIAPKNVLYDLYEDTSLRSDRLSISDDTYHNYYFSTPELLKKLLPYMADTNTICKTNKYVFGTESIPYSSETFCDAIIENNDTKLCILMMCDMNITKLKRFILNAEHQSKYMQYVIVCTEITKALILPLLEPFSPVCYDRGNFYYVRLSGIERKKDELF